MKKSEEAGMEVNGGVPQEENVEIQGPKRKVIREESAEAQDYVRESLKLSLEEAQEISFVPSAISIPQGRMYRCDNSFCEKGPQLLGFCVLCGGG